MRETRFLWTSLCPGWNADTNMLVDASKSFPLYEPKEFKTARPNVSYKVKVYEFTDFDNQG